MRCVVDEECAEGLVFAILLHNKKTQQRDGPAADDATCHAGGDQLRLLIGKNAALYLLRAAAAPRLCKAASPSL